MKAITVCKYQTTKTQGQNKNMSSSIDINAHQNIMWNHNSYS